MLVKRVQLGLIHVAVAMTLVPINSTLNRVMIKELAISATLVALLASLPYLFSPLQVLIGSFSDHHPLWGLRRTPYIVVGLFLCVMGVVLSPQAAFNLSLDWWKGLLLGILIFGCWGMGFNFATVSYLSLASELSGEKGRGRTISVMWFMMIASIVLTAIALSQMVEPYTPQALMRSFWVVGITALVIGCLGVYKLEQRQSIKLASAKEVSSWRTQFRAIHENRQATIFFWYLIILLAAILGQDILLEPFAGQAFGMSVRDTTRITSLWGVCVLLALIIAGVLEIRIGKRKVALLGGVGALLGFILITLSGSLVSLSVFFTGVVLLGIGTGLSTVANLSLMLDMTTPGNVGLFIGAWGMANAISRLIGTVLGGVVRDVVTYLVQNPVTGYMVVFAIEAAMILMSLFLLRTISVVAFREDARKLSVLERTAIASEG